MSRFGCFISSWTLDDSVVCAYQVDLNPFLTLGLGTNNLAYTCFEVDSLDNTEAQNQEPWPSDWSQNHELLRRLEFPVTNSLKVKIRGN
jgi:hypothetical protein